MININDTSNENKNHKLDDADGRIRLKNIRNKEPGSKCQGICSLVLFILLYSPVQLVIRFFGLRLPNPLARTFLLSLLLGLEGKWILAWHNSDFSAKIKQNLDTLSVLLFL